MGPGTYQHRPHQQKKTNKKIPEIGNCRCWVLPSESWKDESGLASFWILVCVEERKGKEKEICTLVPYGGIFGPIVVRLSALRSFFAITSSADFLVRSSCRPPSRFSESYAPV